MPPHLVRESAFVAGALSPRGDFAFGVPTVGDGLRLRLGADVWKRQACLIAGRELTREEWKDALPGRDYPRVCR